MTKSNRPTPSRREFLVGSAAAGAAIGLTPSCTLTGKERPMPVPIAPEKNPLATGATIRMGLIGPGGMGLGHLGGIIDAHKNGREKVQVVALAEVCKPRRDRAQARAEKGQGIEVDAYHDYRDLLARDDIDCVLVAAPEHWHAQMAVDAIESGKDVYLEKPMTLRLDEALWLKRVMDANPHMRIQVGTQYMMQAKYVAAKELIAKGEIGHALTSQTSYCRNVPGGEWLYGIEPGIEPGELLDWEAWCGHLGPRDFKTEIYHCWRRYKDFSTGIIGDLLVHQITPLMNAVDAGWPTRVDAVGGHYVDQVMENHDQVNITAGFERGHTLTVAGSISNELAIEPIIRGHKANLFLGTDSCVLKPERAYAETVSAKTIELPGGDWQDLLRLDWFKSVRTRSETASPVEMATKVMVVVDLATRAMWDGSAWNFDPATLTASRA